MRIDPTEARKAAFVKAHLAAALKGARALGVPVENILGLAALESGWGASRFAKAGNYFGLQYPAWLATGYLKADRSDARVATFSSFDDSLSSFISSNANLIQNKSDPAEFAAMLQNSGKFGINPDGTKVAGYVDNVARTIRRLRPFIGETKT